MRATADFETYSEAGYLLDPVTGKVTGGGLGDVGTPVYACHPSTRVVCLQYDLHDGAGRRLWVPGTPNPQPLFDWVAAGGEVSAWNSTFEWWIWNVVCVRKYGWPPLPLHQTYCDMAAARRFSLPGGLNNAASVLGTPGKDPAGDKLIKALCRPNSWTKKRRYWVPSPAQDWAAYCDIYRYCGQDVVAEDAAAAQIPELSAEERQIWLADQTINARGVRVDMPALGHALALLQQMERYYTYELVNVTDGAVGSSSEVAKTLAWLQTQGLHLSDLQEDTVTEALKIPLIPPAARRALEIRQIMGGANVKKLYKLADQVSSDGRLRGQYAYCGADRTARWSAGGVQLQNMTAAGPTCSRCDGCGRHYQPRKDQNVCPRCGTPDWAATACPDWTVEQVEDALQDIVYRDLGHIVRVWGDPGTLLTGLLRGLFVAAPGRDFICCDFSAIEAVVAACLARCQWRVDVFSTHGKIYEASASMMSGVPLADILNYKKEHGRHHPLRKRAKVRELAGGYGGWIGAWKNFGADEFMTDAEIKADVLAWRAESPEIVEMWGGQYRQVGPSLRDCVPELYGLEGAAIRAIQSPGVWFHHIDIAYCVWGGTLHCRLPSGRFLYYHQAALVPCEDRLGRGPAVKIVFSGWNTSAAKGPVGWIRQETYGGRLFENVVQAVARDIQALALVRLEARGYPVVMHTHDEATAEVREGWGSVEEMVSIMAERPDWASWWPIRAAGWRHKRFQKD